MQNKEPKKINGKLYGEVIRYTEGKMWYKTNYIKGKLHGYYEYHAQQSDRVNKCYYAR